MARKRKPAKKATAKKKGGRRKKATRVHSVTMHRRAPQLVRSLVVVDETDPVWIGVDEGDTPIVHLYPDSKDAIVWIIPPHDATDLAIERIHRACVNDKAATIKLLPRASSAAVVQARQHKEDEKEKPRPKQTARELVMEMADEANSTNKKALKKLLNEVLGEEGL